MTHNTSISFMFSGKHYTVDDIFDKNGMMKGANVYGFCKALSDVVESSANREMFKIETDAKGDHKLSVDIKLSPSQKKLEPANRLLRAGFNKSKNKKQSFIDFESIEQVGKFTEIRSAGRSIYKTTDDFDRITFSTLPGIVIKNGTDGINKYIKDINNHKNAPLYSGEM